MARLIPWDIKKFKEIRKKLDENNVYFKFIQKIKKMFILKRFIYSIIDDFNAFCIHMDKNHFSDDK